MKNRNIPYWICTLIIAFVFLSGGVCYVFRVPQVVEGITQLGFPLYFVSLLGTWKILGGLAILAPGFRTLKEWAYAGMFFDLSGAAVASAATGVPFWHIIVPLVSAVVLFASWALRPAGRTHRVPARNPNLRQPQHGNASARPASNGYRHRNQSSGWVQLRISGRISPAPASRKGGLRSAVLDRDSSSKRVRN